VDRDTDGASDDDLTSVRMPGDDPEDDPFCAYVCSHEVLADDTYSGTTVEALVEEARKRGDL
jgi:hypothetical protein